jgi:hypothetical protein
MTNPKSGTDPAPRCVVLPLQPEKMGTYDGTGLAVHFLLGNVVVLHTRFREFWFGWRVDRIFPEKKKLQVFCRNPAEGIDPVGLGREQEIRYWLSGQVGGRKNSRKIRLVLADAVMEEIAPPVLLTLDTDTGLIGFRTALMKLFAKPAPPFPAEMREKALWHEKTSARGLSAMGRALELFYLHSAYSGSGRLDLGPFQEAVRQAPESFLAQDIFGWAQYRNKDYHGARQSFLKAVRENPSGVGAMSGLMWCGVYAGDREEAEFWAARKADIRGEDVFAAREKARRRIKKHHPQSS